MGRSPPFGYLEVEHPGEQRIRRRVAASQCGEGVLCVESQSNVWGGCGHVTCTTNNHSRRQTEVFCTSQTPKNVVGSFLVSLYTLRIKPHILHPSLCAMRPLLQTLTGPQHSNPAPYTLKSNSAEERRCWPLPLEPLSRSSAFQSGCVFEFPLDLSIVALTPTLTLTLTLTLTHTHTHEGTGKEARLL